jgi:hypothetical protein
MKLLVFAALASLVLGAPSMVIEERQTPAKGGAGAKGGAPAKAGGGADETGTVFKEFSEGGCKSAILIFSRGTTEPRNVVRWIRCS